MKHLFINSVALLALAGTSQAALTVIVENFDNYGSSSIPFSGQNGGSGFSGGWVNVGATAHGYTNANLTSSVTGYTNTGDAAGLNDGAASNNTYNGGLANNNSTRAIAQPTIGNGETVWFSFMVNMASTAGGNNALFSPFGLAAGDMFNTGKFNVGVTAGRFSVNGLVSYTTNPFVAVSNNFLGANLVANTTYLIVGRTTIDAAVGAPDILDVWFNPTDVSSIASLGAAQVSFSNQDFSTANAPDPFRTSGSSGVFLNGITVGIRGTDVNKLDSIRIAYDGTDQENFVAVIPEPSTTLLVGLGGLALAFGRRRSTAA